MPAVEPILLTVTQISTMNQGQVMTNATGFFFARGERLFLITSRHVVINEPTNHRPDQLQIDVYVDTDNLAKTVSFSIPLYRDKQALWKQGSDSSGLIDVAAIPLQRDALPESMVYRAFTPDALCQPEAAVEVGSPLMVVGFPLGFADTLHHLPVVRQAVLASSFGLRFQGMGYFLTDALTHRGISGAPVVMRIDKSSPREPDFHWLLLGVHSSRLDVGTRDLNEDEALGLNCAWYADIIMTLTE